MRRIFTLLTLLAFVSVANAQYQFPVIGSGNPGNNLNTDLEYPEGGGQPTGWTGISTVSATNPIWSTNQTIPFDFNFAGQLVTSFKVSTSGVLTFTTNAANVPAATPSMLPSASLPDNSIACWGISGRGTNDKIFTKVFGQTPNRQLWIQFNSFSLPSPASVNCYTYWSIVLEEGTDKFYVVDQRNNGCAHALTVGWQIDGSTSFALAGSPSFAQVSGADPSLTDNVYYEFAPGTQATTDLAAVSLNVPKYTSFPSQLDVKMNVINKGSQAITGLNFKYQVNNGAVVSQTLSNVNIAANGGNVELTHGTPINIASQNAITVKAWVEVAGDLSVNDDTLSSFIGVMTNSFTPTKRVLFEEATGTWCGWCPRGTVYMDSIHKTYPTTAMLVAVHNNDPMAVTDYDAGMGGLISGYPSGLVDREPNKEYDPSEFFDAYDAKISEVTPCDVIVDATYNAATRTYDITIGAKFATDLNGDFRLNAIVTEDHVTGSGNAYSQTNYYAGGANGDMGNFHNLPDPVPSNLMEYNHVGRGILGGFESLENSLPTTITSGSTYSATFSYVVPLTQNPNEMHIIGYVIDASTGQVFNANEKNFASGVTTQKANSFAVSTFPNPSLGKTTFEVKMDKLAEDISLEVYDLTGRLVYSSSNGLSIGGSKFINWEANENVANGVYQALIKVGNETVSAKVVLAR